jgi:UDP-N-acetylglucosamine diphosphorylase / glucose-1-phosphate thymidylyltransferase / UDP-N-acetylgalactosamine diphosphorylase / glucosamine-1-phosphate N-acetyltransferase / galactosamine-1-phosphate N-acetyltransferase
MTRVMCSLARRIGLKHDRRGMSVVEEVESVRDAVILAAGRGTRMKTLTEETPKPMLPVAGRPLLEHVVLVLRKAGIARFLIVTGYRGEQIEAHFRDGAEWGVKIAYRRQAVRDGTARALLLARDAIGQHDFLLAWGDILADPANYPALLDTFARRHADGLISVNWVDDPSNGAAVYVDGDQRIKQIVEKPAPGTATTHWNNAGIAVFRPVVFEYAAAVGPSPRGEYEIPDAITAMLEDGLALYAFPLQGFWSDIGTPEDLQRAARVLSPAS